MKRRRYVTGRRTQRHRADEKCNSQSRMLHKKCNTHGLKNPYNVARYTSVSVEHPMFSGILQKE